MHFYSHFAHRDASAIPSCRMLDYKNDVKPISCLAAGLDLAVHEPDWSGNGKRWQAKAENASLALINKGEKRRAENRIVML